MLVLTRRPGESIRIGDDITVTIEDIADVVQLSVQSNGPMPLAITLPEPKNAVLTQSAPLKVVHGNH